MRIYWSLLVLALSCEALAQNDTITLKEITVEASTPESFIPGASHYAFSTDSLVYQNLAETLSTLLPVSFIEYGAPGQLSSINFRGLGAGRTTLRWQGMEINSFSLGQSDYGSLFTLPGYGIKVGMGPGGAIYGNGAIGGAISIDHEPKTKPGLGLSLGQEYGSFGSYGIQAGVDLTKAGWGWSGVFSQGGARNNFPFKRDDGSTIKQVNAAYQNTNLAQNFYWKPGASHQLSGHLWYNKTYREIQPNRQQISSDEQLENHSLRALVNWVWAYRSLLGSNSLGYTRDHQIYNGDRRVTVDRWYSAYEMEWALSDWDLKAGTQWNHLVARVDAYGGKVKENRNDFYFASRWEIRKGLILALNARAPVVDGRFKALSPLASMQFQLPGPKRSTRFSLDLQVGRSYLIPTLNQRFWQPGGNPDLKPENSFNWETGIKAAWSSPLILYEGKIRYFHHRVKDWIIWIPGGSDRDGEGNITSFWYPDNLREVLAQGIEFNHQVGLKIKSSKWSQSLALSGTFQRAVNKRSLSSFDRGIDRQLPYTPQWILVPTWEITYDHWSAGITGRYIGERFVETNNELPPLPAYTLWQVNAGASGKWRRLHWSLELVIKNLFNRDYENFENRAMPGRNFNLNLLLTY